MTIISAISIYLGNGDGTFNYTGTYPVEGSYPFSVAVGDFDNDKNLDIVTSIYGNSSAGIFLGYGNGTFRIVTTYSTASDSNWNFVAVGDFNSDHLLDFAVTNFRTATISIHLGYGNGSFRISMIISTGDDYASCIAIGDVNNDTYLDLIFTDPYSFNVDVLLGYGNGSFGSINAYSTGVGSYPWSVALGYFDNDIFLDIAVTNQWDFSISLLLGYGNGSFKIPIMFSTGFYSLPSSIVFGDFNNDNQSDIVVSNTGNDNITVFLVQYDADFTRKTMYITGSRPHPSSIIAGHFNNNSQLDIAVANAGTNNIQISLDYNKGNFRRTDFYPTGSGSNPQYVTAADINNDGQLDILVANNWTSNINVMFGFGNGTFDEPSVHSTGSGSFPSSIAVGDLTKNDWIDAVVANKGSDNVGVFLGFDYPTFTSYSIRLSKLILIPLGTVTADFNNDHRLDIAVANSNNDTIGVLLGYGNGSFREQITYSTGSAPSSIAVGDFNHDHQLDMAVANSNNFSISVLLGNGNGTFAKQVSYSTNSSSPINIAVGDFNNDNNLDIVVANQNGDCVGVFLGYANGTFSEQVSYRMSSGSSPRWVAVGDLNNDHILDIVVTNMGRNEIGVLLGYGNGTFKNVTTFSTERNSGPCSIAIGDFNLDTFMDIAVANQIGQNVGVFFGYGDGTFWPQKTLPISSSSFLTSIAIGDLNQDNVLDIAVTDWGSGNGNISVLYGYGDGTFTTLKTYSTGLNSYPSAITIGDFDNDTRVDLATSISNIANIIVMLRYKSTPYSTQLVFSTGNGSSPSSVAIGDFDHNDQLDIAVANFGTNNVGILLRYSNQTIAPQKVYSTGFSSQPNFITVADFNNDTHLDIATTNSNTNNIGILFGKGDGTFAPVITYSTGIMSNPSFAAVQDLNKDNYLDLVIANTGTSNVLIFYGRANGTFSSPKSYTVGYGAQPLSVTIGDFDNDNLLDIAVANSGTNYVEIFLQTC